MFFVLSIMSCGPETLPHSHVNQMETFEED
jgi:hypothetical protein